MNFGLQDLEVNPICIRSQAFCQVPGRWCRERHSAFQSYIVRKANRRQINSCRWVKAKVGVCGSVSKKERIIDFIYQGGNRDCSLSLRWVLKDIWTSNGVSGELQTNGLCCDLQDENEWWETALNGSRVQARDDLEWHLDMQMQMPMPRHLKRYWSIFISHLILCVHMQVI